jgi:hypothetical protein
MSLDFSENKKTDNIIAYAVDKNNKRINNL